MKVAGLGPWHDLEVVERRGDTLVLQGRDEDGRLALIKTHASELPTSASRERLRREHDAVDAARHDHLVAPRAFVDQPNRAALVLDHPLGPTLAEAVRDHAVDLDGLLVAGAEVADALAALHAAGLVHRAVDAEHVVLTDAGAVLVDLYDACPVGARPRRSSHGAHTAPEDRAVELPPASAGADQHALAATLRLAIDQLDLEEPVALAATLDEAVHPDPRRRHRSVLGLGDALRAVAAGSPTEPDRLLLTWEDPEHLVGRDAQLARIAELVRASLEDGRLRVVVVRGPHGSGRSRLLGAVCDRLADAGVVHGFGRFDDGAATVPLQAPADVMEQVVTQLLTLPDDALASVTDQLRDLGPDLSVACEVLPHLAQVVGDQPAPPAAGPEATVARIERVVPAAIQAIAAATPPLVVAFDDIDRADATSTRGLEVIAGAKEAASVVALISTSDDRCRADEVFDRLRASGVLVEELALPPLSVGEVERLLSEGTGSQDGALTEVADAVWARSRGNPQVVLADVWSLLADGHLWPDPAARRWRWSSEAVDHDDPTTVDEVARARVATLPPDLGSVVAAVALAGRAASVRMVELLTDRTEDEARSLVAQGIARRVLAPPPDPDDGSISCLDDGVRRAALERHHDDDLEDAVARAVLASVRTDERGEPAPDDLQRYELVHLLSGRSWVLEDPEQVARLVRLCEEAARTAHRAGGFHEALQLQQTAIDALGERGWGSDQARTFELHLRAAEHALMVGDGTTTDALLDAAWAHQPSALQRVRAMEVLGTQAWISQDHGRGLDALCATLAELGHAVPADPTWADVAREAVATTRALGRTRPEQLLDAPPITDPTVAAALDAMLGCVHLAYVDRPRLHLLLALRGTRLTAEHGVIPASAYFLTAYGMLQISVPRGTTRGLRFGAVGRTIADRSPGPVSTMVTFAHNSFVRHWGTDVGDTIEPMLEEYRTAIANRQRGYGLTGGTFAVLHALLDGRPLWSVEALAADLHATLEGLGEHAFCQRIDVVRQAVDDLRRGESGALDGRHFSAPRWLEAKPRRGDLAVVVHTLRAMVLIRRGDLDAARQATEQAAGLARSAPGQAVLGLHWFQVAHLDAEALLAAAGARPSVRARLRARAERSLHRLRGIAAHAPANAAHRVAFVEAVLAESRAGVGTAAKAMERYDAAVVLATEHGALDDLGLIAERAARFHATRGRRTLARHYATLARDAWLAWGADALADSIGDRLPSVVLGERPGRDPDPPGAEAPSSTGSAPERPATEHTFAEATRLLGQELEVRELLDRLVEILMRHADATRGHLVLESPHGPVVEVAARLDGDVVAVTPLPAPHLSDHDGLCAPAVHYVLRTRSVLSLVDPAEDRRLRSDAGLRERAPRALLCLPIGRPSGSSGVLVLESDRYRHAFEAGRVEALHVLSEQAIAALDHARMSSDLSSLADDVAELRSTAASLAAQAETDPLTGVANRLGLETRLGTAITDAHAGAPSTHRTWDLVDEPKVGVLFCDLDGFKEVNDRHGHAVGDLVLAEVAERVRQAVRAEDIVARVGGDEFVVVSVGVSDHELRTMADRLVVEVARPVVLPEGPVSVSASVGVGRADLGHVTTTDDVDALVQVADEAMYRAKQAGKNRVADG